MRKLVIVLVVLTLLAAGVFFAASRFNGYLRDNREWLAQQATAALGRPVRFDDIGVSFRGGLGARVSGLSIGDDPAFSSDDFVRVASADVVVKILPALRGSYEIRRIVLDAPQINVVRRATGFNFESIGKGPAPPVPAADATSAAAVKEAAPALQLLVSLMNVENGRVRFVDRRSAGAVELVIESLDVSASDLSLDRPVSFEVAAAILGAAEQNLFVDGTIGPLGDPNRAAQAPVAATVRVGPVVLDRLKDVALVGPSIPPSLSSPDPIDVTASLSGVLDALHAAVSVDASRAAIKYAGQFDKPRGVRLRLDAELRRSADAFEIAKLDLYFAEAHLSGKGRVGSGSSLPFEFQFSGRDVPLDGWARIVPATAAVETSGALDLQLSAKGNAGTAQVPVVTGTIALKDLRATRSDGVLRVEGLNTVIAVQGDRVEIPATDFQLNGVPVQVTATVKSIRDLSTEFSVKSRQIELATLGVAAETVASAEVVKDVEARGKFLLGAEGPKLDVTLKSSAGSIRDVSYGDLVSEASLRGQKLTLDRVSVTTFGGNVVGAGSYDISQRDAPTFSFRGKVGGLDVAEMVARFAPAGAVKMVGRLDAEIDVRGRGAEWDVLKEALTGGGSVEVKDGVLRGVNVADEVLGGLTGVPGLSGLISPSLRKKYPEIFAGKDTVFEALGGKMTLGGGDAVVEQLALVARDYQLKGKGTIGLDNQLDLAVRFITSERLTKDLLGGVRELRYVTDKDGRFQVPVVLRGSLPSIRLQPDLQYLTEQLSGALLQSGIEKGLGAILGKKEKGATAEDPAASPAGESAPAKPVEDSAEKLIRKGLEGLFGGSRK